MQRLLDTPDGRVPSIGEVPTLREIRPRTSDLNRIEDKIDALLDLVNELNGSEFATAAITAEKEPVSVDDSAFSSAQEVRPEPGELRIVLVNVADVSEGELNSVGLPMKDFTHGDSTQELIEALDQRDRHIVYLTTQIREFPICIQAWLRILQLEPGESAAAMKDAEDTVSRLLQLSEMGWSVERAKLARERSKLAAERRLLAEHRSEQPLQMPEKSDATALQKRWDKFFPPHDKRA